MSEVQRIAVGILPLLFAITVHEVAHGWMARRLGDPTAFMLGRLTLNPIKHIDPLGTVLLPLLMYATSGLVFGWAKPVPVTARNLRNPRRDMALVALAGPGANLLMALLWAFVAKLGIELYGQGAIWSARPLAYMGEIGIRLNLMLMVLNLLPVPPLDGSRVLSALLPGPLAYKFERLETYGLVIVMVLLFTGLLNQIIAPPIIYGEQLILSLFGLS